MFASVEVLWECFLRVSIVRKNMHFASEDSIEFGDVVVCRGSEMMS